MRVTRVCPKASVKPPSLLSHCISGNSMMMTRYAYPLQSMCVRIAPVSNISHPNDAFLNSGSVKH